MSDEEKMYDLLETTQKEMMKMATTYISLLMS